MGEVPSATRQQGLRLMLGVLLCSLVFLFSVSAKLAAYRQAPAAIQIKSMKLLEKGTVPVVHAAPDIETASVLFLVAAFSCVGTGLQLVVAAHYEPVNFTSSWFSPRLSVRPPPIV